jgi:hypothetical protein
VGLVVLIRRRDLGAHRAGPAVALAGAAAGALAIVPFGYIAERYLADAIPLLAVGAAVGVQGLAGAAIGRRAARGAAAVAAVVLTLVGAWVNVGLALRYQRHYAPNPRPVLAAELVRMQAEVGDLLGGGPEAPALDGLPAGAAAGSLVAVGDCAGLYVWGGATPERGSWVAVERTRDAGHHVVHVDLASLPLDARFPLAGGTEPGIPMVWVERRGDEIVGGIDGDHPSEPGRPQPIRGRSTVDVVLDPYLDVVVAYVGDQPLTSGAAPGLEPGFDVLVGRSAGRAGIESATPGLRAGDSGDGALCRRLVVPR